MTLRNVAVLSLCCIGLLYGQTDAIAVTAYKTVELNPEEVTFNIAVLADQDTTLDQALQAVQGIGVTAKDLVSINTQPFGIRPDQARLTYQFAVLAEFSKFKETLDKIAAARRALAANNSNMELQTFGIQVASSDAARDQALQTAMPDLIAEARHKGEFLAQSAGVSLGPIQGLSEFGGSVGGAFVSSGPFFGPSTLRTTFGISVRFGIQ